MSKYNKPLFLILIIVIFISFFQLYSFAGNNDSLPPYGYSGKGDDKWKYTSHHSALRVSIYWAPSSEAFATGDGVIPLGNTTDFSDTGPWYQVAAYTGYSIYWYMNDGEGGGREYDISPSMSEPYDWAGYGDKDEEIVRIVDGMPNVWYSNKEQWDDWFEGPIDKATKEKGYENIPDIARVCGVNITKEQFKKGELNLSENKTNVMRAAQEFHPEIIRARYAIHASLKSQQPRRLFTITYQIL